MSNTTDPPRGSASGGGSLVAFPRARERPPDNLPLELTSFVGREREVAEVERLLAGHRFLTLTGPGGCGKSRLALKVAAGVRERFEDGVWWVELAALSDPKLVGQAVAAALEVREQPDQPPAGTLSDYFESRKTLLVLDNCEHLVGACAALVGALLRACPDLHVLATSREVLGFAGERAWLVPPLSLPGPGHLPVQELERYEAVRLFVQRAAAVDSGLALTPNNAPVVAGICRRLDGMPLALELAAARAKVLSVEQISTRLHDSFALLRGGSRSSLPRHQTLRATIEWSHDLLGRDERVLFRGLSVFAGRFTLSAAETVCAGDDLRCCEVLDLLAYLVDKSLVLVAERGDEEARYRMLETVRQYGWEKLEEAGEALAVRQRYAGFFLKLAEEAEAALQGPEQGTWLERLELEHDNLRGALGWFAENGDVERGFRLGGALWRFWWLQGHFAEGRAQLEALLELPGAKARTEARAKALYVLGVLANRQADYAAGNQAEAHAYQQESLRIYRELGDEPHVAGVLRELGRISIELGNWATARPFLDESLRLERESGSEHGVALTLNSLGWLEHFRGENAVARPLFEEARAIFRESRDDLYADICLFFLGRIATDEGDYAEAHTLLSATVDERLPHYPWVIPPLLEAFAGLGAAQGQAVRALRLAGAAIALRDEIGVKHAPAWRTDLTHRLEPAWRALDERAGAAAWEEGRAMTPEEAVDEAIREPPEVPPPEASLRVLALGPAWVEREGRALTSSDWTYVKSRELLLYLLSHPSRTRAQIGLDLWPDASPDRLRRSFHDTLYHLRRALGRPEWIVFQNDRYAFNRSLDYFFDVETFETELQRARRPGDEEVITHLKEAVGLYRGDFLEDLTVQGEWALIRREELRRAYGEALLYMGRLLFAESRYAEAADAYRKATDHDNYLETAHRGLMRCHARLGERGRAIRHYRDLVELLCEELGSTPAAETTTLHECLRRGEDV